MLKCGYCGTEFKLKGELTLHLAHVHNIYSEGYFQVLQSREKNGYYMRQINYWKRKR